MRSNQVHCLLRLRMMGGICGLLALAGCQESPFIKLQVSGLAPEVTKIEFIGRLDDKREVAQSFSNNDSLSTITASLPAGARGRLNINLNGYDHGTCFSSSARASVTITADDVYELPAALERVSGCGLGSERLTVTVEPRGSGSITSTPTLTESDCKDICNPSSQVNTMVAVSAMAQPGYTFQRWQNASGCDSQATCMVDLRNSNRLKAIFEKCTGWCNETPVTPDKSDKTLYSVYGVYGVYGASPEDVVAVGAEGTIWWSLNGHWTLIPILSKSTLRGVGRIPSGNLLAVGEQSIFKSDLDPQRWTQIAGDGIGSINAMAATTPTVVVGKNGLYLKNVTSDWKNITGCEALTKGVTMNAAMKGISNSEEHFVVGDNGFFMHSHYYRTDNTTIFDVFTCTNLSLKNLNKNLFGLWVGNNHIYLVGAGGTLMKCNKEGLGCEQKIEPTDVTLYGIWGDQDGKLLYAVGERGTILKSTDAGEHWSAEPNKSPKDLRAIWGTTTKPMYAVGQDGIILHYRE